MTKKELVEMLKDVGDDEELTFVKDYMDRDGFPYDVRVKIYKVIGGKTKFIKVDADHEATTERYGILRIVKA